MQLLGGEFGKLEKFGKAHYCSHRHSWVSYTEVCLHTKNMKSRKILKLPFGLT